MKRNYTRIMALENDGYRMTLERVDSPEGVEQPLVPPERSDKGPGDAEQRSVESRAVPPGKAEAAHIEHLMDRLNQLADMYDELADGEPSECRMTVSQHNRLMSATTRSFTGILFALLPKPDSDATTPKDDHEP
jgi:hypothetical protein